MQGTFENSLETPAASKGGSQAIVKSGVLEIFHSGAEKHALAAHLFLCTIQSSHL